MGHLFELLLYSVDNIHKGIREGLDVRTNRNEIINKIEKKHTITKRMLRDLERKLKNGNHIHTDEPSNS